MTGIDWDRPYDTLIFATGSKRLQQDGKKFDLGGNPIEEPKADVVSETEDVGQDPVGEPKSDVSPEAWMDQEIRSMLGMGLTHTQIAERVGTTRQKVTSIARSLP